ncbi:MAG: class I SAM-dependent methyltransferase [Bacilli bacterium]|nr:class I SAM-dependent methyltransferase [Bacilli bacterium]
MKALCNVFHDKFIYNRRMEQLYYHLSSLVKKYNCSSILDIGAGDGKIDKMIQDKCNVSITGIDVLVRDYTYIPVIEYDGNSIPLKDNSINATMMIDVLHHTDNPSIVFNEAVRVSNKYIIVKDHIKSNWISYIKLKMMDYVGNKHYSVRLPYNYLTKNEWDKLFNEANVKLVKYKTDLNLYSGIFHLLFDKDLHFIAVLEKEVK